jgi:hypothetical protein
MIEGFMVYWVDTELDQSMAALFSKDNSESPMGDALSHMKNLRKISTNQFVTMVSQNANSVGKPGVDSVENGKLPNGEEYSWSKAGRAGKMRLSDLAGPKAWVEP